MAAEDREEEKAVAKLRADIGTWEGERQTCQAQIWPSWANRWMTCGSDIRPDGRCVRYGHPDHEARCGSRTVCAFGYAHCPVIEESAMTTAQPTTQPAPTITMPGDWENFWWCWEPGCGARACRLPGVGIFAAIKQHRDAQHPKGT